jgi:hypothetical protein
MPCIHCGAQLGADPRFCPSCGQPIAQAPNPDYAAVDAGATTAEGAPVSAPPVSLAPGSSDVPPPGVSLPDGATGMSRKKTALWAGLAAGAVTLVIIIVGAVGSAGAKVDTADWEKKISASLAEHGGKGITIDCPDSELMKDGYVFDCVASDGTDKRIVRVTQEDARGNFRYLVTDEKP